MLSPHRAAVLCLAVAAVLLLAGCGGSDGDAGSAATPTTPASLELGPAFDAIDDLPSTSSRRAPPA